VPGGMQIEGASPPSENQNPETRIQKLIQGEDKTKPAAAATLAASWLRSASPSRASVIAPLLAH